MKPLSINLRTLAFVVSTRAALAAGLALLASPKIPEHRRRRIGFMLVAIGAATTIPAARTLLRQIRAQREDTTLHAGGLGVL